MVMYESVDRHYAKFYQLINTYYLKHLESVKESKLSQIEKTRIRNDEAAVEIAKIEKEIIFASPNNPKIHQHLKFIKNCAKVTPSLLLIRIIMLLNR